MKTIGIVFLADNNKQYHYLTDDESIAVNDYVIVESPYSGIAAVKVTSVTETADSVNRATKWIVQKVDMAAYEARKELSERRQLLEAKIEKAKKEAMKLVEFRKLAELSPELAALVTELEGLK